MTEPTPSPTTDQPGTAFPLVLGAPVRDRVTGFAGVVTACCVYLAQEDRYLVSASFALKGELPQEAWYPPGRLEVTGPRIQL